MLAVELRAIKIFCETFSNLGGGGHEPQAPFLNPPKFIKETMAEQSQFVGHWKVLEQWKNLGLHTHGYMQYGLPSIQYYWKKITYCFYFEEVETLVISNVTMAAILLLHN